MTRRLTQFFNRQWPLILAFVVPFLLMSVIHAAKGVYPFGNETVLTIDLGQQYVDFYAYFRQSLLEDPSGLFYSFSKAIGGDMLGVFAYYLASPFNLLFLLFPTSQIALAVTVMTMIKYGFAGWSFGYFLKKEFDATGFTLVTFATSYALMGFTVVNQFNLMWLDGVIFLPLIVLGLERLLKERSGITYTLFLALALFANYYIGYMICFFLVLYVIFRIISLDVAWATNWKEAVFSKLKTTLRFAWHSLLAGGLAAILLLPTLYSLRIGKASDVNTDLIWETDYPFPEMISKFFIGAFNFDQMPNGYPNLFIGSLALLCFCFYFFNRAFPLKERLTAFALTLFFVFSLNVDAMNKIWHGMQYPNWYPYRFSFVVSFFLLLLAYRGFTKLKSVTPMTTFFTMIVSTAIGLYVYQQEFDFLEPVQIVITLLFIYLILLLLILKPQNYKWMGLVLFAVTMIEMGVNAGISLSRLSYVNQDTFTVYQQGQKQVVDWVKNYDDDFYRFEKTFLRTKNDSFSADFNGITHFSSTFESSIPDLFGKLGNPTGGGFLTYSNGTLLTDALFGIRYYASDQDDLYWNENENMLDLMKNASAPLVQGHFRYDTFQPSFQFPFRHSLSTSEYPLILKQTKPDLKDFTKLAATNQTIIYENPYSLPIAFGSSQDIASVYLQKNRPIQAQEAVLSGLIGNVESARYFSPEEFTSTIYQNVLLSGNSMEQLVSKDNEDTKASVTFQFTPETNDAYYITLNDSIHHEDVSLSLNGESYAFYDSSDDVLINNVANEANGQTVSFEIELLDDAVSLEDIQLYRLDKEAFAQAISTLQTGGINIEEYGNTHLKGTVTIQENQNFLMTTIPYSEGWTVTVDGVPVQTEKVLGSLIGISIGSGTHEVEFTYQTPYLVEGAVITLISGLLLIVPYGFNRRKRLNQR